MNRFQDAVCVVTGGASGLGRAVCEELGRRGAVVVVADVNEAGAREVASGIGGKATAAGLDVRDAGAVRRLIEETAAAYGRLDYVFNNAGIAVLGEVRDLTLEHWRKVLDVNLDGVIHGVSAAYPLMVRQGSGHIVNTASLAGLAGFPTSIPYATSKFAVVGLSLSLRAEAEELGVKVSAVCPGFVQTAIFDAGTYVGSRKEDLLAQIPFKIIGTAEAARAILRGVERNQAVIVFPFYARLFWWLTRLHPGIAGLLHRKTVRDFRKVRSGG
jgi:NAD(P)-dependent dehydrogenase (short-subunit alcohol dehydrogenase family)